MRWFAKPYKKRKDEICQSRLALLDCYMLTLNLLLNHWIKDNAKVHAPQLIKEVM